VQDSSSYANLNPVAPTVSFAELVPSWCPLAKSPRALFLSTKGKQ